MGNSGIIWEDTVFNWCLKLLYNLVAVMDITNEEINVYFFVIIVPLVLLLSILLNIYLLLRIRENSLTKNSHSDPKESIQNQMLMRYTHLRAEDKAKKLI